MRTDFYLKTQKGGLTNKMNIYRKFKKSTKALSPVVASIILIAVTVAVSVVVAAWMGGMTIGLMGSAEEVKIINIEFDPDPGGDQVIVMVQNQGGQDANITNAFINGASTTMAEEDGTPSSNILLPKSSTTTIRVDCSAGLSAGSSYTIKLITAKGTSIVSSPTIYST
jgi:flagellin-like protein